MREQCSELEATAASGADQSESADAEQRLKMLQSQVRTKKRTCTCMHRTSLGTLRSLPTRCHVTCT